MRREHWIAVTTRCFVLGCTLLGEELRTEESELGDCVVGEVDVETELTIKNLFVV
jgi:hypothetical protein